MKRTVFFFPEPPRRYWRVPIATIGDGPVRPIPHVNDPRWSGDVPRILAALAAADPLDGTEIPLQLRVELRAYLELGDLVRVTYPDGRVVDLDEETPVGWRPGLGTRDEREPSYPLMAFEPDSDTRGCVYFEWPGPRALSIAPLSKARGSDALIAPRDGAGPWEDGGAWVRVRVESWEEETRRLRAFLAALADECDAKMGVNLRQAKSPSEDSAEEDRLHAEAKVEAYGDVVECLRTGRLAEDRPGTLKAGAGS